MRVDSSPAWLTLRGIHKRFGPTHALKGVDLDLVPGQVLAVIGENGAGKSTLVKTLTGVYQSDEGEIRIEGKPQRFLRAQDAQAAGIVAVHQETVMFEELSAAENIFIGRQPMRSVGPFKVIDWARMNREAQAVLDQVGAGFASTTTVKNLSLAQRHLIEIARALSQKARVVILDEPTAALSQAEIRDFYGLVRGLKAQGVAVLFITHKFDEIFAVCDRYVVLRDGASVGEGAIADADEPMLVKLMAGRAIEHIYPAITSQPGEVVLKVQGLSHPSEFADLSFELRRGEILGFYGLVGAGRSEAMLALMGLNPAATGEVTVDGKRIEIRRPGDAIAAGMAYVPEERQRQGGILGFSVRHNISLAGLASGASALSRGPWLSPLREGALAAKMIERLRIKTASQDTPMSGLSGGNQQKVVIAKWLGLNPRIVILDEPTKGIDVGAKQAVYHLIAEMVEQGLAVILVSSELPEVMHLAHRVIVMRRGRMASEFAMGQADAETVVAAASGLELPPRSAVPAPLSAPDELRPITLNPELAA
ncbi:ABC transporter-related protein [Leptothrix cholodnii SP-6]|uniref:ABC transporter-related protein n=1 Tax=Leptothrix cholodnii (strain ATCC 51168 / LMG 8142 / SP-6) TaxID=395495 RepID=B1Y3E9_LEPCP|nr:sugar ABC transporter ATP-binding protein [Leptothrix cholodnii]ACB34477.1 ABC transporter-related protein [Leptothrix cholodnii SP-6]